MPSAVAASLRAEAMRSWNGRCWGSTREPVSLAQSMEAQMATSNQNGGAFRKFVDVQKALKGASYPATSGPNGV